MDVKIINSCSKPYQLHHQEIITKILKNIPEKFLVGLAEVRLFDYRPSKTLRKNCVCKTFSSQSSIIEIYLDDPLLQKRIPFFSLLLLNTIFLGCVNEHVLQYLQPHSSDEEILRYPQRVGKINLKWGVWGIWRPILSIVSWGSYLAFHVQIIRKIWLGLVNRLIEKHQ